MPPYLVFAGQAWNLADSCCFNASAFSVEPVFLFREKSFFDKLLKLKIIISYKLCRVPKGLYDNLLLCCCASKLELTLNEDAAKNFDKKICN